MGDDGHAAPRDHSPSWTNSDASRTTRANHAATVSEMAKRSEQNVADRPARDLNAVDEADEHRW